jgi:hypothetical protein
LSFGYKDIILWKSVDISRQRSEAHGRYLQFGVPENVVDIVPKHSVLKSDLEKPVRWKYWEETLRAHVFVDLAKECIPTH